MVALPDNVKRVTPDDVGRVLPESAKGKSELVYSGANTRSLNTPVSLKWCPVDLGIVSYGAGCRDFHFFVSDVLRIAE